MNLDLSHVRIGYAPSDESLNRPGDRRRFAAYAKHRNLKFEFAHEGEDYDLLLLAPGTDITPWLRNAGKKTKLIVDTIDSYLAIPRLDIKALLRGPAKFVFGDTRYLVWNFNSALKEICRRADAVVCSTIEQKNDILPLCENVHIILDVHDYCKTAVKRDYAAGAVFNFVWEGLPLNVRFFSEIRSELLRIQARQSFALHLVTDVQYGRFLSGKLMKGSTIDLIAGMFDQVYLYSWSELLAPVIIASCDLALIPVPLDDPLNAGKPENKLLIFWRLGVPAIVSATPAYARVMQQSDIGMAARTSEDWSRLLDRYMSDEAARRDAGQRGKRYAEEHYGFEKIFDQWDSVIKSVLD